MQECLGGEDLADRRGERGPAGLFPDHRELLEHLHQAVARRVRAQVDVERGDEAGRQAVLRGKRRDPGRQWRHGLVADVLVDEVRCPPQDVHVDTRVAAETGESAGDRFA